MSDCIPEIPDGYIRISIPAPLQAGDAGGCIAIDYIEGPIKIMAGLAMAILAGLEAKIFPEEDGQYRIEIDRDEEIESINREHADLEIEDARRLIAHKDQKAVGVRARAYRMERGLSIGDVARAIGARTSDVSAFEHGDCVFYWIVLRAFEDEYGEGVLAGGAE